MVAPERKISAVIALFFVTPLVAEYLLGDLLGTSIRRRGGTDSRVSSANGSWLADDADAERGLHVDRRRLGDAVTLQS
jgi:hypothetical protein